MHQSSASFIIVIHCSRPLSSLVDPRRNRRHHQYVWLKLYPLGGVHNVLEDTVSRLIYFFLLSKSGHD